MKYSLQYTKIATKDIPKLKSAKLDKKAKELLTLIQEDPFAYPPEYELLQGKYYLTYSRRINKQHRLVYEVYEEERVLKIISLWTHYER